MTTATRAVRWSPIGAFEMKRSYWGNMFKAVIIVLLFFALIIGGIALIRMLTASNSGNVPTLVIKDISELGPPPSLARKPQQIKVTQEVAPPKFTLPEAVPDEEVTEDFVVVSQEELAEITSPVISDQEGTGNIKVDIPLEDYLPSPDEFVAVEEQPVLLHKVQPKYPEIARKAGIEGSVWVKVLVDKDGKVRDAIIVKESGANAGFEEAALAAAKQSVWKPAMQNKQPVALWVAYEVKFQLKGQR